MMFGLRLLLLAITLSQVTSSSSSSSSNKLVQSALKLIDWVKKQENGQFNEKQELRVIDGKSSTRMGIFAASKIEKGEILSRVPWNVVIDDSLTGDDEASGSDDENEEDLSSPNHSCVTFHKLIFALEAGLKSTFRPYLDYLLVSGKKLPYAYSEGGQELLVQVLDRGGEDERPLLESLVPPFLETEWLAECGGRPAYPDERKAAELMVQYAFQKMMIPTYDLYTHRNGKWHNTEINIVDQTYVEIVASRTIEAGEQIHSTYSDCNECHEGMSQYSVAGTTTSGAFLFFSSVLDVHSF